MALDKSGKAILEDISGKQFAKMSKSERQKQRIILQYKFVSMI